MHLDGEKLVKTSQTAVKSLLLLTPACSTGLMEEILVLLTSTSVCNMAGSV